MARQLFMLVLSVFVVISMGVTLTWFFRRLRRIEEEKWGKEERPAWRARLKALRKRGRG